MFETKKKSAANRDNEQKDRTDRTGRDDEPVILTQRPTGAEPYNDRIQTGKKGTYRRKKIVAPAEDADGETTQGTYRGKRPREKVESAEDSDDHAELLSQSSKYAKRSRDIQKKKKTGTNRGKRQRKKVEPAEDSELLSKSSENAEPSDEGLMKEKTDLDQLPLTQKGVKKRPWSATEKAAVWRQLGQYITLETVPGKDPCLKALQAEPELKIRTWKDIKNQVYNSITAQKRKRL